MNGKATAHLGHVMGIHPYGWILQLIILAAVVLIIIWVLRSSRKESALDIVKKRYAKGEITDKEYHKIKSEIL